MCVLSECGAMQVTNEQPELASLQELTQLTLFISRIETMPGTAP